MKTICFLLGSICYSNHIYPREGLYLGQMFPGLSIDHIKRGIIVYRGEYMIKNFREYLNEIFSTVLPFTKQGVSSNTITYHFTAPNKTEVETIFEFHKTALYPDWEGAFVPGWYLEFSCNGEFDITGGRNAFVIFSTVIGIIRDFMKTHQPEKIYFTATQYEQSRVDLYTKMVKSLSKDTTYEYAIENQIRYRPGLHVFVLTRR